MLRNYLKITFKVFARRKFFTFVTLFGISFTLVVLMVATAMLDHTYAPHAPEVHQDRTVGVFHVTMWGPHNTWMSEAGYRLLDHHLRDLPGAERMSIYSDNRTVYSYPAGDKIKSSLKRTDGEFWRILRFDFLEGGPYTQEDVDQARFVAVINAATRERFFAGATAVGRTLEADGQRFRVVGVVSNVPVLRRVPFADIWVPLTTAKNDSYKTQVMGGFYGIVLARDRAAIPGLKAEFKSRVARVELPDPKEYQNLIAPLETPFETMSRMRVGRQREEESHTERLWAQLIGMALLFMFLPTINLVNLNVSRIMERASEIGVRKAFGASSRTLVGQFVVENVALTLVGGAVGLVLSLLALEALNASGLIQYSRFALNPRVFLCGLGLALFFGVFSGVYPAWRMSRLHPVEALRGASR
jgi:putative ABC transport system permease protein